MFYEEPGKVVQTRPEAGNFPNVPNQNTWVFWTQSGLFTFPLQAQSKTGSFGNSLPLISLKQQDIVE